MYSPMRWMLAALLFSFLILPPQLFAQQSQDAQKMDVLIGQWEYQDMDGQATCERLGETMVHCLSVYINDEGESTKALWMLTYDAESDLYKSNRFYSHGHTDYGYGWVDGKTWIFAFNMPNGNRAKITSQITEDSWTYQWHISRKGGPWEEGSEGSLTKIE